MAKTNLGKVSLTPKGEYSASTQYERLDIVQYGGSSYIVLKAVNGITPTNGSNYMLMASKGNKGNTFTYDDLTAEQKAALISLIVVDDTLTQEGQAADAKTVGGAISNLHDSIANALKAKANGALIHVDDVSPIEHTVRGKVSSINLFNIKNISSGHLSRTDENNSIHLSISNQREFYTNTSLAKFAPGLKVGDRVVFTADTNSSYGGGFFWLMEPSNRQFTWGTAYTITQADLDANIIFYKGDNTNSVDYSSAAITISNICLTIGDTAPDSYIPYIGATELNIETRGKNLVNISDVDYEAEGYSRGLPNTSITGGYASINKLPRGERYTLHCDIETDGELWTEGQIAGTFFHFNYTDGTTRTIHNCVNVDIFDGGKDILQITLYGSDSAHGATYNKFKNFILCFGSDYNYEPYKEQSNSYTPNSDGTFEVTSISPNMNVFADASPVNIELEYSKDTSKCIAKMQGDIQGTENDISEMLADTSIVRNWYNIAYGKIENLFNSAKKPIITIIDDDTSYVASTAYYHDLCNSLGVKGNYAVLTTNLEANEELKNQLLDYESEGFGVVVHAYSQGAFYNIGSNRDLGLAEADFIKGLRHMSQFGFVNFNYWCTPFGVCDNDIMSLAKKHGMKCAFSAGNNAIETDEAKYGRYALRRVGFNQDTDLNWIKAFVDECFNKKAWLIITTHTGEGNWATNADSKFREFVNYAKNKGCQFKTVAEAWAIKEPIYRFYEMF